MAFPCPGCGATVPASPEAWIIRCPACGGLIRSRTAEGGRTVLAYDVEIAGRPQTRRRIEVPWDEAQQRRLRAWLAWASAITLLLVGLLFVLARWVG